MSHDQSLVGLSPRTVCMAFRLPSDFKGITAGRLVPLLRGLVPLSRGLVPLSCGPVMLGPAFLLERPGVRHPEGGEFKYIYLIIKLFFTA
jgi:hypothetical protein